MALFGNKNRPARLDVVRDSYLGPLGAFGASRDSGYSPVTGENDGSLVPLLASFVRQGQPSIAGVPSPLFPARQGLGGDALASGDYASRRAADARSIGVFPGSLPGGAGQGFGQDVGQPTQPFASLAAFAPSSGSGLSRVPRPLSGGHLRSVGNHPSDYEARSAPIVVRAQNAKRVQSMPQAQFNAYDRRYQAQQKRRDQAVQRGPKVGFMYQDEIEKRAAHAWDQFVKHRVWGMDIDNAAAWAANIEVESSGNRWARRPDGGHLGYLEWGPERRQKFQEIMHIPFEKATGDQQLHFRDWELQHTYAKARDLINAAKGAGAKAATISNAYEQPGNETTGKDRAAIAEAIARRAYAEAEAAQRRARRFGHNIPADKR